LGEPRFPIALGEPREPPSFGWGNQIFPRESKEGVMGNSGSPRGT